MPQKHRVTLSQIAEALGVSVFTVSASLSGSQRVAPATRAKVEKAAKELGYRRSNIGGSLRSGRTMLIGVVSDRSSWLFGERWEGDWLSGIHDAAKDAGYRLLFNLPKRGNDRTWRTGSISPNGLAEMTDGMVDGIVVLGGMALSKSDLRMLADSGLPLVFAANDLPVPGQSQVHSGVEQQVRSAATSLLEEGHRRIAFAGVAGAEQHNELAQRAFKAALKAHGVSPLRTAFKALATDNRAGMLESWEAAFVQWSRKDKASALMLSYGDQSRVLLEMTARAGLDPRAIPRYAALGGHNNPPLSFWQDNHLWDADAVQGGRDAMALLLDRLRGGKASVKSLFWTRRSVGDYWLQGERR